MDFGVEVWFRDFGRREYEDENLVFLEILFVGICYWLDFRIFLSEYVMRNILEL